MKNHGTLFVRAQDNINSIDSLNGKNVNLGEVGSGSYYTSNRIFKKFFKDIKINEFHESLIPAIGKLNEGEIDAICFWRAVPAPHIEHYFSSGKYKLLSLTFDNIRNITSNDNYSKFEINQQYPGIIETVNTISVAAFLVASDNLDKTLVKKIIREMVYKNEIIAKHHKIAVSFPMNEELIKIKGVSQDLIHDGAKLYFNK